MQKEKSQSVILNECLRQKLLNFQHNHDLLLEVDLVVLKVRSALIFQVATTIFDPGFRKNKALRHAGIGVKVNSKVIHRRFAVEKSKCKCGENEISHPYGKLQARIRQIRTNTIFSIIKVAKLKDFYENLQSTIDNPFYFTKRRITHACRMLGKKRDSYIKNITGLFLTLK